MGDGPRISDWQRAQTERRYGRQIGGAGWLGGGGGGAHMLTLLHLLLNQVQALFGAQFGVSKFSETRLANAHERIAFDAEMFHVQEGLFVHAFIESIFFQYAFNESQHLSQQRFQLYKLLE